MKPFDKIQHRKKRAFLLAYSESGSITEAAETVKIDRTTHYDWKKNDADYPAAFAEASIITKMFHHENVP
jgi:hypothetical protein|tara:strand:- start:276 stop:485 length:210 start_codon:yes stop_codon:yes gene_type:complete